MFGLITVIAFFVGLYFLFLKRDGQLLGGIMVGGSILAFMFVWKSINKDAISNVSEAKDFLRDNNYFSQSEGYPRIKYEVVIDVEKMMIYYWHSTGYTEYSEGKPIWNAEPHDKANFRIEETEECGVLYFELVLYNHQNEGSKFTMEDKFNGFLGLRPTDGDGAYLKYRFHRNGCLYSDFVRFDDYKFDRGGVPRRYGPFSDSQNSTSSKTTSSKDETITKDLSAFSNYPHEKREKNDESKVQTADKWGIVTPTFVINVAAVKTEKAAQKQVAVLKQQGYSSGYFWIPDYKSLSGAEYYSVYIGPITNQKKCEEFVETYRLKNQSAYATLLDQQNKRVEIRGVGKVKVTENYGR